MVAGWHYDNCLGVLPLSIAAAHSQNNLCVCAVLCFPYIGMPESRLASIVHCVRWKHLWWIQGRQWNVETECGIVIENGFLNMDYHKYDCLNNSCLYSKEKLTWNTWICTHITSPNDRIGNKVKHWKVFKYWGCDFFFFCHFASYYKGQK